MGLLETLRTKFNDCTTTTCEKKNCKLSLDGINQHQIVILDNDLSQTTTERLCDYLLFYKLGELVISAVELKGGGMDASSATEQLKNGAKKAEELSNGHEVKDFIPLLLRGRRAHTAGIKKVLKTKIPFRGRKLKIVVRRCGYSFKQLFKEL